MRKDSKKVILKIREDFGMRPNANGQVVLIPLQKQLFYPCT